MTQELITEEQWQERYEATKIEQELIDPAAGYAGLPATVERICCVGKSCGNTSLKLVKIPTMDPTNEFSRVEYAYVRESNDDLYFGPSSDPALLVSMLNDRVRWPVDEAARDEVSRQHIAAVNAK